RGWSGSRPAGGRMRLSGWLRYPAAALRARRGAEPQRPWIVPAAIGWLGRRIRSDWSVLELGAGRSTPWLARRAGIVLSFEDNEFWHQQASERLAELDLINVDLRLRPVDSLPGEVTDLADDSFDLVVLDFLESPGVS